MTTGTDEVNQMQSVPVPQGYVWVGTYWRRGWRGDDRPGPPPSYPGDGTTAATRAALRRPPKRARAPAEHSYEMYLDSTHAELIGLKTFFDPQGPTYFYTSDAWCIPSYLSTWTSNDDLKMLSQLREKILGSTFNAATSMAELPQTLKTIFTAAGALAGAYGHARKGNFKSAGKSLAKYEKSQGRGLKGAARNIGSNWLEFQYGVRPLLNDVYDAAQTLAHLMSFPMRRTYTVTRRRYGSIYPQAQSAVSYNEAQAFTQVKIKAIVEEVNILGALGLNDPAGVVWEKLPYSFVIDWFIPIGDYLAAAGLARNLTGTFVTSRTTKFAFNGISVIPSSGSFVVYGDTGAVRWRHVDVTRTVSGTLDVPMPSVKPLGSSATWQHTLNALALLTQLRPGR